LKFSLFPGSRSCGQIPMINNPAPQTINRKSRRWLPPSFLLALALITLAAPAMAQYQTFYDFHSEWLFPPVHDRCAPPLPTNAICSYPSPQEVRFRNYIKTIVYRWMSERKLPAEDLEGVILKFGRTDLIADINAYVAAGLLLSLEKPAESRTPDEHFVVSYFEQEFLTRERALYNYAVQVGESWQKDPCNWKPDPEVAAAYGLSYDATPYCRENQSVFVTASTFHIPGPKAEYLYAAAFKEIYGGGPMSLMMQDKLAGHLGGLASAVTGGGVAGGIIGASASKITPFANAVHVEGYASKAVSEAAKAARYLKYTRFLGGGAFTIVTMMLEVGVEAIIAFDEQIKFQQGLDNLRAIRDRLGSQGQDPVAAVTSEEGLIKAMIIISRYGLFTWQNPPLPAYRPGIDRLFVVREGGIARAEESLKVKDHGGQTWQVQMWQNWFIRTATADGLNAQSITTELEVTDHEGIQWTLTRVGPDRFRMTQLNAPETAIPCPSVNGISTMTGRTCSVFFSDNVNVQLENGAKVNLHAGIAPRIQSTSFFFPANTDSSFPVNVTGLPAPVVQLPGLPVWLRLVNGSLVGNPGTWAGKHIITLTARSQTGSDQKAITIYYGEPIQFMSPAFVDVVAAERLAFTINTAGTPRPKMTMKGWLPPSFSFRDNGNGTATLSGMWESNIKPVCFNLPEDCVTTIIADNGAQRVEQRVDFGFRLQPDSVFQGPSELKFIAGVEGRYLLTTSGARTPVEWKTVYFGPTSVVTRSLRDEVVQSLPWLRFEERPDGTALVHGIPPLNGQSGSTLFQACPVARGSVSPCGALGGNLKVTVDGATRFMSTPVGGVAVGALSEIPLFVNRLNGTIGLSPYHILTSRFPKGLRIEPGVPGRNGMVTARILGSPEPGQGGRYEFMLNWTDQLSTVYSLFRLDVPEAASITSPATFTFFEGTSAAGQVTTQGYPVNSAGVDCGPGIECADMSIRMQWGPRRIQGLTLTDRTPEGTPTGVGRFEGTIPAGSSGVYEASFSAANGRWRPEARQLARLVVLPTPDLNGDGTVDCSDLTAIKNAIGTIQPGPGRGFDLTGDMLADDKDIDAMVRAVPNLCTCQI
jgi:hypothetical protein